MLRGGSQLGSRLKTYQKLQLKSRKFSTSPSSTGRSLALASGLIVAGGVATVGVAWQKPSFRKNAEESFPPSKYLFNPILGPLDKKEELKSKPVKKPKDIWESPLKEVRKSKEQNEELEQKNISSFGTESSAVDTNEKIADLPNDINMQTLETAPEPILEEPLPLQEKKESVEPLAHDEKNTDEKFAETAQTSLLETQDSETQIADSAPLERTPEEVTNTLVQLEEDVLADTAAISTILDDALSSCAQKCMEAIDSNTEASKAISLHTSLLKNAMDETESGAEEKRNQWTDLSKVLEQKSRLQSEAENLSQDARQELLKLESIISEVKRLNNSDVNNKIIEAEENCNDMRKELENASRDVNVKLSESHVISQYKDLVETAKEQFRQELMSVMPDVQIESGWRKLSQKLSNDDLNALIAHAHRRVDQLQRELAEERAISTSRMEMAVKAAREIWDEQSTVETERKMELLKRQSETEYDKKLEEARQAFESEMRVQLKRQAAAHSEHLADMLGIQEKQIKKELDVEFKYKLDEQEQNFFTEMEKIKEKYEGELHEITDKFQFDLNRALAKVAGIETAIDGRAHIENETRKAQELWLACEALRIAVQYGDDGKPVPLQRELQAISQVEGLEPHVIEVVKAFPERASDRGVFSEEALRLAYKQVSKMCRRLSLINETRNSFFSYILSYLKSFLIINRAQTEPPENLDPDALDTFRILSYATYCLERGDLEQATRFMNQLTGESRRVAEGWLEEARLLLETKQTLQVLSSLASASSIAANLEM